jgi:hypothetical protein
MWKRALADAVLFFVVSYLGMMNRVPLLLCAVVFAALHGVMVHCMKRYEYFDYMPDSREPAACPPNSERAENGLDCKLKSDRYGIP